MAVTHTTMQILFIVKNLCQCIMLPLLYYFIFYKWPMELYTQFTKVRTALSKLNTTNN